MNSPSQLVNIFGPSLDEQCEKKNVKYLPKYKYRQWHWSILGNTSQAGADEVLKKPNLPPRGVPNPNGAQSRFTARLSDLYGTSNSSGHLWNRKKNTRGKTKIIFKMFKWSKTDLINKKTHKTTKIYHNFNPKVLNFIWYIISQHQMIMVFWQCTTPLLFFSKNDYIYILPLFYLIMIFLLHNYY